jgi:hypothetical protein
LVIVLLVVWWIWSAYKKPTIAEQQVPQQTLESTVASETATSSIVPSGETTALPSPSAANEATYTASADSSTTTTAQSEVTNAGMNPHNSANKVPVTDTNSNGAVIQPSSRTVYTRTAIGISPGTATGLNGWYSTRPTITLSPNDGRKISYRYKDRGAWSRYSAPLAVPDGRHTFQYYAYRPDKVTEGVRSIAIKVDCAAPGAPSSLAVLSNIQNSLQLGWNESTDALSGVQKYEVYTTDGVLRGTTSGSNITLRTLTPGSTYEFYVRAIDNAGNQSAFCMALTVTAFMADVTPPVTTLSSTPSAPNGRNGWFVTQPTLMLTSSEAGMTWFSWDGNPSFSQYIGTFQALEGNHSLAYYSVDHATNTENAKTTSIKVDLGAPGTVSAAAVAAGTDSVDVTWQQVNDAVSGVQAYEIWDTSLGFVATVTPVPPTGSSITHRINGVTDPTSHHYSVHAIDLAGNVSLSSSVPVAALSSAGGGTAKKLSSLKGSSAKIGGSATFGAGRALTANPADLTMIMTPLPSPPAAPSGYRPVPGTSYDIVPSYAASQVLDVQISYDPAELQGSPSNLRMMHYTGGHWVDVTLNVDSAAHVVNGATDSFSPFELMEVTSGGTVSTPASTPGSLLALAAFALLAAGFALRNRREAAE